MNKYGGKESNEDDDDDSDAENDVNGNRAEEETVDDSILVRNLFIYRNIY